MWLIISSLLATLALCAFILIAIYLGTVAAMVIVAATCAALILGSIALVIGVLAIWLERRERKRWFDRFVEQQHG